jgi:apolipoprotein D and lipocalin family protein
VAASGAAAAGGQPRLLAVPSVDPQRYAGTWYEIARLPNRFQAHCTGEVVATYTPRPDGAIAVVNRCRTGDGDWDVAPGLAQPLDGSNARLRVSFLPAGLRWLPFGRGDYWVLELDPDYRWAMIGEPGRDFLWVLSRQPVLPQDTLESLLGRAREMGFAVDRVRLTPQKPPPVDPPPAGSAGPR